MTLDPIWKTITYARRVVPREYRTAVRYIADPFHLPQVHCIQYTPAVTPQAGSATITIKVGPAPVYTYNTFRQGGWAS